MIGIIPPKKKIISLFQVGEVLYLSTNWNTSLVAYFATEMVMCNYNPPHPKVN